MTFLSTTVQPDGTAVTRDGTIIQPLSEEQKPRLKYPVDYNDLHILCRLSKAQLKVWLESIDPKEALEFASYRQRLIRYVNGKSKLSAFLDRIWLLVNGIRP
jgi:hypothetical protein